MTELRTSEAIHAAADQIEARGWVQGKGWIAGESGVGPLCVEGALIAVLGVRPKWQCPAWQAVTTYLAADNPDMPINCLNGRPMLFAWNDQPGRTASEVIEVLRAAAAIEQAREDAAAADMIALLSAPVTDAEVLAQMGGTA